MKEMVVKSFYNLTDCKIVRLKFIIKAQKEDVNDERTNI